MTSQVTTQPAPLLERTPLAGIHSHCRSRQANPRSRHLAPAGEAFRRGEDGGAWPWEEAQGRREKDESYNGGVYASPARMRLRRPEIDRTHLVGCVGPSVDRRRTLVLRAAGDMLAAPSEKLEPDQSGVRDRASNVGARACGARQAGRKRRCAADDAMIDSEALSTDGRRPRSRKRSRSAIMTGTCQQQRLTEIRESSKTDGEELGRECQGPFKSLHISLASIGPADLELRLEALDASAYGRKRRQIQSNAPTVLPPPNPFDSFLAGSWLLYFVPELIWLDSPQFESFGLPLCYMLPFATLAQPSSSTAEYRVRFAHRQLDYKPPQKRQDFAVGLGDTPSALSGFSTPPRTGSPPAETHTREHMRGCDSTVNPESIRIQRGASSAARALQPGNCIISVSGTPQLVSGTTSAPPKRLLHAHLLSSSFKLV
ncbi:hypothetical protein FB451DRAFT_1165070 [Mycena latifolia]|nr:hypothetical protein FB451DRAFT_1165070 [Mycena latifolia]